MIFERALLTTIRSFNPSPSKSATRRRLIWLSMGYFSGPVKPKRLVGSSAPEEKTMLATATTAALPIKRRIQIIIFNRSPECHRVSALASPNVSRSPDALLGSCKRSSIFRAQFKQNICVPGYAGADDLAKRLECAQLAQFATAFESQGCPNPRIRQILPRRSLSASITLFMGRPIRTHSTTS
ncbi:hypothetical protein SBV1_410021 [Verrucomicrobia bacterium]|nr:hypothetical protein SBV1_410021 [Verrucomicrobiota bacterium]